MYALRSLLNNFTVCLSKTLTTTARRKAAFLLELRRNSCIKTVQ